MTMTQDIAEYYSNLLIVQYHEKPKAQATIETVVTPVLLGTSSQQFLKFSSEVSSGNFKLSYDGVSSATIAWNASTGTIDTTLTAILPSPLTVVVTGSIADGLLFTFEDYTDDVELLSVVESTLNGDPIPVISSVGPQLPLAVQDAFNMIAPDLAIGVQLDIIGKYVGVSRSGYGFFGPITLDDTDYYTLIQMGIIRNSAGSSLAAIQAYIHRFFGDEIILTDYKNMHMSYVINTSIGNQDLIQLMVVEDLLPRPMAVGLSVIVAPDIEEFFGFVTYDAPTNPYGTPFNTYDVYSNDWIWVSYSNSVTV